MNSSYDKWLNHNYYIDISDEVTLDFEGVVDIEKCRALPLVSVSFQL